MHIVCLCFIFAPSVVKVSQNVSELQTQTIGLTLWWSQFTKGHDSVKTVDGVMYLISATCLIMFYICFKKIFQKVSELLSGNDLDIEICKGALFTKTCRWNYGTCSVHIV